MNESDVLQLVDRYLHNELSPDERAAFEQLRRDNADVDHMVVQQRFFLDQLKASHDHKDFENNIHQVADTLHATGMFETPSHQGKLLSFWQKHKKVISIAASIAGVTALLISSAVNTFTHQQPTSEIKQLSQALREVKITQLQTDRQLKDLKMATSQPADNAKLGGTGFLIDPKGYLVTSAHTVVNADSVYIQNTAGLYYKAHTVYVDSQTDIAILKITDEKFAGTKSLPYSFLKSNIELGENIFTLGFPRPTADIVYNRGYLSAKTGYLGDSTAYQLAISANPGNSGGPIFNESGEVIGILSGKQTTAEGVVFSSRASNIYTALKAIKQDSTLNENIKIPAQTHLKGIDRMQQIKKIEPYVFIVKSY